MMLWDIIRDFFVQYVFGGMTSQGTYFDCWIGQVYSVEDGAYYGTDTQVFGLPMKGFEGNNSMAIDYIAMGDWLSTTATIIVLVLLCVCAGLFVRWMFKWIGGCLSRLGR